LEHYSEDGENYEEAIADLMETRQVSTQIMSSHNNFQQFKKIYRISYFSYLQFKKFLSENFAQIIQLSFLE